MIAGPHHGSTRAIGGRVAIREQVEARDVVECGELFRVGCDFVDRAEQDAGVVDDLAGNGQYFTLSGSMPAVSGPWVPPSTQSNPASAAICNDDSSASLKVETTSSITSKPASWASEISSRCRARSAPTSLNPMYLSPVSASVGTISAALSTVRSPWVSMNTK